MTVVYILQSESNPQRFYVGLTQNLNQRIRQHNAGQSPHTANFKPWKLIWFASFLSADKAKAFEAYLKTGSGRRFQKRHLGIE